MRKPYRVIVWGPGAVGVGCLRELHRRPEFEIAGVLCYGAAKVGRDAGELIGVPSIGITLTDDKEAMFGLDADVVIWCGTFPFAHMADEMDRDVIRLLESGKHVVTPVAYHYPPSHGADYLEKFEQACRKGQSCLHGTGENPGFWFERVALTLTGLCNDVESITLDEYADTGSSGTSTEVYNSIGFGVPLEQAMQAGPLNEVWKNYYFIETLNLASMSLYGRPLDHFEHNPQYYVAEEAFTLSRAAGDRIDMDVAKGHVKAMTHRFNGYVDGKIRLNINTNWFLTRESSPFAGKEDSTWDIEIEGRPTSLKCSVRAMASIKDQLEFRPGDTTSPTWYATIMPAIQAIPILCSHQPGIVYPSIFASCAPDIRLLETRTSIVG